MNLDELEKLAEAATPGPWFSHLDEGSKPRPWKQLYVFPENSRVNGPMICLLSEDDEETQADAAFIAATRTAVPELIAEVRRLREEKVQLTATVNAYYQRYLQDLHEGLWPGCTCAMTEASQANCPVHGYNAPEL